MNLKKMDFYMSAIVSGFALGYALVTLFGAMDVRAFVETVKKMRKHQVAYWREGRKQSDLIAAKELEKEVDRALAEGIAFPDVEAADVKQNTLFE